MAPLPPLPKLPTFPYFHSRLRHHRSMYTRGIEGNAQTIETLINELALTKRQRQVLLAVYRDGLNGVKLTETLSVKNSKVAYGLKYKALSRVEALDTSTRGYVIDVNSNIFFVHDKKSGTHSV
jgi:predicted transcriptional regulator